jgi:large subunit ribosomal protein L9
MKVILTHEVSGLGTAGDVVDVKDGYARNYLFPRKLGTSWTAGGQKQVDSILKARESRTIKSLDDAKAVKSRIEGTTVTLSAKAGNSGRLFGAVSGSDLAAAVVKAGGPGARQAQDRGSRPHQDGRLVCRAGAAAPRGAGQARFRGRQGLSFFCQFLCRIEVFGHHLLMAEYLDPVLSWGLG